MRFSSLLASCLVVTFSVGGCVFNNSYQSAGTVAQKQDSSQISPRTASASANVAPNGQNVATSRFGNQPAVAQPEAASGKLKAAILLPLSGPNAPLGQAMLNAAQQAVFDAAGSNFELQPRDTESTGGAEQATRTAVAEGASLIIGPLFAAEVPAVKRVAQSSNIQILPLSTDTSVAERGVYVMGLAPGPQVERVVSFARARGAHHFAALVPATPYGNLVAQVLMKEASQNGATVADIEIFDPAAHNLEDKIKALATHRDQIDALLLPEGSNELKNIADQLAAAGFNSIQTRILGTGLWDVPGIGKLSPFLVGAWYAAPDAATRRTFVEAYKAAYAQEPPRLATLAYDATALAAVLAKHGGRYDEASLTNPNGFAGLDGIFRLMSSGKVERALAINEVTADGAHVVDESPTSFVGAGR